GREKGWQIVVDPGHDDAGSCRRRRSGDHYLVQVAGMPIRGQQLPVVVEDAQARLVPRLGIDRESDDLARALPEKISGHERVDRHPAAPAARVVKARRGIRGPQPVVSAVHNLSPAPLKAMILPVSSPPAPTPTMTSLFPSPLRSATSACAIVPATSRPQIRIPLASKTLKERSAIVTVAEGRRPSGDPGRRLSEIEPLTGCDAGGGRGEQAASAIAAALPPRLVSMPSSAVGSRCCRRHVVTRPLT